MTLIKLALQCIAFIVVMGGIVLGLVLLPSLGNGIPGLKGWGVSIIGIVLFAELIRWLTDTRSTVRRVKSNRIVPRWVIVVYAISALLTVSAGWWWLDTLSVLILLVAEGAVLYSLADFVRSIASRKAATEQECTANASDVASLVP